MIISNENPFFLLTCHLLFWIQMQMDKKSIQSKKLKTMSFWIDPCQPE